VSHFDELHPALRHHIVNSLRWRELRPFQEAVIPEILAGKHLMILAPTAGGKTEAAILPVMSRMLSENWTGFSILYICPIKALLNNLEVRLDRYFSLLGRRAALWHGDVTTSARRHVLLDPPDCLLTTPESLELMLISRSIDSHALFSRLRVVIVDEIHAFAGDDRGWHLLAVLERITRLAGREMQRIGLSATVGNPEVLLEWLAGHCQGERSIFVPPAAKNVDADVILDYVGSLSNAATIISRLHRGEKRLVFLDSRARAEEIGADLRKLGVTTFVTHSSLSQDQRKQAEDAFANRDDCVIVATSVLELGVDVGDLDRVIQIDSPATVGSFLQRMGRTGRRAGTRRNCLFLATADESLIQAAGLIRLWTEGYIEPIEPPAEPYHVLAQQLMALVLQEDGIGKSEWFAWLKRLPVFAKCPTETIQEIVNWMLHKEILWEDQGILGIGPHGEAAFGRRHFSELLSVFLSAPLFAVLHGNQELGFVDELTFLGKSRENERVLLLGGRAWQVRYVDWSRRIAYVDASEDKGRSRWKGSGPGLRFSLCESVKRVLGSSDVPAYCSQRAQGRLQSIRTDFAWVAGACTSLVLNERGCPEWWTFAGDKANASLAAGLSENLKLATTQDSFTIRFSVNTSVPNIKHSLEELSGRPSGAPTIDEAALAGLKFSECLPKDLALHLLQLRGFDELGTEATLSKPVTIFRQTENSE